MIHVQNMTDWTVGLGGWISPFHADEEDQVINPSLGPEANGMAAPLDSSQPEVANRGQHMEKE